MVGSIHSNHNSIKAHIGIKLVLEHIILHVYGQELLSDRERNGRQIERTCGITQSLSY